jgi:hypothetical protein
MGRRECSAKANAVVMVMDMVEAMVMVMVIVEAEVMADERLMRAPRVCHAGL